MKRDDIVCEKLLNSRFNDLLNIIKSYHPSENMELIKNAFNVAYKAHKGQFRKSGEPFMIHPLEVAIILAQLNLDKETIAAALLHDVIEDTHVKEQEIEIDFGTEIVFLVQGVTKLNDVEMSGMKKEEIGIENIKKILVATNEDIRVMLIKLADRLHNLRTLQYKSIEAQIRISTETLDIYVPIASRLGLAIIQYEMEDICFFYTNKSKYNSISKQIERIGILTMEKNSNIKNTILQSCQSSNISCSIDFIFKNVFSIYKKMARRNCRVDELYDTFYFDIIVDNIKDCYTVLGILHSTFTPVPMRFKDYIAMPKTNSYQAIHTTLISKTGLIFETQIKTKEMKKTNLYGITASWQYKERSDGKDTATQKMKWLQDILKWLQDEDNRRFFQTVKNDFNVYGKNIFCISTNGTVVELPMGSIVVDFALALDDTSIDRLLKVKVNNMDVSFEYELMNGDIIDIHFSEKFEEPQSEWINKVKTEKAKSLLIKWYKENAGKE